MLSTVFCDYNLLTIFIVSVQFDIRGGQVVPYNVMKIISETKEDNC